MWNIFSQEECVFHKREYIFTEMGRHKHCPEFGQVAINSFGIHGVVSKIPGILHHHGSGLFSVLFETEPHWWDKCSINHTHTKTVHTKGSSRNLKPFSQASNLSSEEWLHFCEIVVQHFFKVCTQNSPAWKTTEVQPSFAICSTHRSVGIKTSTRRHCFALLQQAPVQPVQILTLENIIV